MIPDWWTPEVFRLSQERFELLHRSDCCDTVLEDWLHYKLCPRCRTAYSPVPDYGKLELEEILDVLGGE